MWSTDQFILPGLSLVGAPWAWATSHYDTALQRGAVSCVAAVDTWGCSANAADNRAACCTEIRCFWKRSPHYLPLHSPNMPARKNKYYYNNIFRICNDLSSKTGAGIAQSVQCLTTDWTTGRSGFDPRRGQRIFPLTSVSRQALGPIQPPVQCVLGVLSPGQSAAGEWRWPLTPI
jgi:hypothetical protein